MALAFDCSDLGDHACDAIECISNSMIDESPEIRNTLIRGTLALQEIQDGGAEFMVPCHDTVVNVKVAFPDNDIHCPDLNVSEDGQENKSITSGINIEFQIGSEDDGVDAESISQCVGEYLGGMVSGLLPNGIHVEFTPQQSSTTRRLFGYYGYRFYYFYGYYGYPY